MAKKNRKIEIYTANKRWVTVELIRFLPHNLFLIRLPDGQVIRRKAIRFRPVIKRIISNKDYVPKEEVKKKKKVKKKRNKKKKFSKPAYILQEYKKDMKAWKKKAYGR